MCVLPLCVSTVDAGATTVALYAALSLENEPILGSANLVGGIASETRLLF